MAHSTRRRGNAALLSGWLFADLLLVLFLVALVSVPLKPAAAHPAPTARKSTASPSPRPSPSPPVPRRPPGLDPNYLALEIAVSPDQVRASGIGQFRAAVDRQLRAHRDPRPVGLVLIFAAGPDTPEGQGQAIETANKTANALKAQDPVFAETLGLGYWGAPDGTFDLKIFFLNS